MAYADLLCAFANTYDIDVDAPSPDTIANAADLTRWLRAHELLQSDEQAGEDDVELARSLRSGLREAMLHHHDGDSTKPVAGLETAAAELPIRVGFDGTRPRLTAAGTGAKASLARLLVAMADAEADKGWVRLKVCLADECQWAFYDTSKNRSRQWCSMGVCGNRQKTRNYRARRREADLSG